MGVSERHAPAALPPGKIRYPLYGRLGGSQGRSGRVWKISLPPGFDPRTVQPVASRYTDWAIPVHRYTVSIINYEIIIKHINIYTLNIWYLQQKRWTQGDGIVRVSQKIWTIFGVAGGDGSTENISNIQLP